MVKMALAETNYPDLDMPDSFWADIIDFFVDLPNNKAFIGPHGFLAATLSDTHFCLPGKLAAVEVAWWIHPEYRKSGEGKKLYQQFYDWAKENNCDYILQGTKTKDSIKISEVHLRKI